MRSQFSLKQLHKKQHNMQSLNALALSWAVRVNWGHMGRAVKCSCSSLTSACSRCALCLPACRGLGNVWPMSGRRKCSAHIWEQWLTLGPSGSAAPLLSNPKALISSSGAPGSNPRHRTVKTHLVTERRSHWEAVIQFTSKKGGQKGTLLWLLGPTCSLSSLLCISACLQMCPTYGPCMSSIERCGRLVTEQHRSCSNMLSMFDRNQRAKTRKCGDKVWKRTVIREIMNRKQHGLRHWAASWKD